MVTILRESQSTPSLLGRNEDDAVDDDLLEEEERDFTQPKRPLMLLLDVNTRWNSLYLSVNRFLKLLPLLNAIQTSQNPLWTATLPLSPDLEIITGLHSALQPFYDITKISQTHQFPTLGFVPAWVDHLVVSLNSLGRNQKTPSHAIPIFKDLLSQTEKRFAYLWGDTEEENSDSEDDEARPSRKAGLSTLLASAFLPQYGQLPFAKVTAELRNLVWEKAEKDARLLLQSPTTSPTMPDTMETQLMPIFDDQTEGPTDNTDSRLKIALRSVRNYWRSMEHRSFLASLSENDRRFLDPLAWWKTNQVKFDEILYPFIQGLLSAQGTSAAAESAVSGGGNLKTKLRNQLLPKRFSEILFIQSNVPLLFNSVPEFISIAHTELTSPAKKPRTPNN